MLCDNVPTREEMNYGKGRVRGGRQINLNVNGGASSTHHGALEGVELLEKFRIF